MFCRFRQRGGLEISRFCCPQTCLIWQLLLISTNLLPKRKVEVSETSTKLRPKLRGSLVEVWWLFGGLGEEAWWKFQALRCGSFEAAVWKFGGSFCFAAMYVHCMCITACFPKYCAHIHIQGDRQQSVSYNFINLYRCLNMTVYRYMIHIYIEVCIDIGISKFFYNV